MAQASATGYLELNIAGFQQAVKTVERTLAALGATFAAFKVGEIFKDGTKSAIDFGNQMYIAGQKTGSFDPGKLLLVQKALERAGLGAEEARAKIDEFIDNRQDISAIFSGTENYAKALREVSEDYGDQAGLLSEHAEKFSLVFDDLKVVGEKMKTFFLAMASEFLKPMQVVLGFLKDIDLVSKGKSFGDSIATGIRAVIGLFKNGDVTEALKLGAIIAFKEGINYFAGGVKYVGELLVKLVIAAAQTLVDFFTKTDWGAVFGSLLGIFASIGLMLMRYAADFVDFLSAGILTVIGKISELMPESMKKKLGMSGLNASTDMDKNLETSRGANPVYKKIMELEKDSQKLAASNIGKVGSDMKNLALGVMEKVGDAFSSTDFNKMNLLDSSSESKELAEILGRAKDSAKQLEDKSPSSKIKINEEALKPWEPMKVVADKMAQVGGGGGFLKVGQNILEREAVKTAQATVESAKVLNLINNKINGGKKELNLRND